MRFSRHPSIGGPNCGNSEGAFTIPEMMITLTIFSLLVIAAVYSHIFGLKLNAFTQAKLNATHNARAALNTTRDEIRSAKKLYVGYGGPNAFTNTPPNKAQQGNAVQIYATDSTNDFVRFYMDPAQETLNRVVVAGGNTSAQVLAKFMTNLIAFHVEDFAGNILTNDQNNRVICMNFEIYQFEFAPLQAGRPAFYDYYHLQTKVARRAVP